MNKNVFKKTSKIYRTSDFPGKEEDFSSSDEEPEIIKNADKDNSQRNKSKIEVPTAET